MIQPTLINLHPKEYTQRLHHYPFTVNLDGCVGSCIILNYLFKEVSVPNKLNDLHMLVFSMITGINGSKILTKHISCKCECKFDGRKKNQD